VRHHTTRREFGARSGVRRRREKKEESFFIFETSRAFS